MNAAYNAIHGDLDLFYQIVAVFLCVIIAGVAAMEIHDAT